VNTFRIFQHVSALGYPDELKLFITIESVNDCHRFQSDLERMQEWSAGRKFGLNAAKCKAISFNRNKKPIRFDYRIGGLNLNMSRKLILQLVSGPPHQVWHSEKVERIQHNIVSFAFCRLRWMVNPLPAYDSRCALLGFESLGDRRTITRELFICDLLCNRIGSAHLISLLRFESNFFLRTNYGRKIL
jgi:hypothetical protein